MISIFDGCLTKIYNLLSNSLAYLLELIVRTFLLRDMGSNRVIITLEQQVDVLEESRTSVSM